MYRNVIKQFKPKIGDPTGSFDWKVLTPRQKIWAATPSLEFSNRVHFWLHKINLCLMTNHSWYKSSSVKWTSVEWNSVIHYTILLKLQTNNSIDSKQHIGKLSLKECFTFVAFCQSLIHFKLYYFTKQK